MAERQKLTYGSFAAGALCIVPGCADKYASDPRTTVRMLYAHYWDGSDDVKIFHNRDFDEVLELLNRTHDICETPLLQELWKTRDFKLHKAPPTGARTTTKMEYVARFKEAAGLRPRPRRLRPRTWRLRRLRRPRRLCRLRRPRRLRRLRRPSWPRRLRRLRPRRRRWQCRRPRRQSPR